MTVPLEERDWERFHYYAQRIRRIGYSSFGEMHEIRSLFICIHPSVLQALSFRGATHPLFPKLRAFCPDFPNDPHMRRSMSYVPALLGPTVTEVSYWHSFDAQPEALSSITRACPNLSTLTIQHTRNINPEFSNAFQKAFLNLPQLKSLTFGCAPTTSSDKALDSLIQATSGRLSSLRSFCFDASQYEAGAKVLELLQYPLECLNVYFEARLPSAHPALANFTSSFVGHPCISFLTSLTLEGHINPAGDSPSVIATFRSLFVLKALRYLRIVYACASLLDNQWIQDAAMNWPQLETFILDAEHSDPTATLAGLIPLVRYCPRLTYLTLPLHAKPFPAGLLQPGDRNMALKFVDFVVSPISTPVGVFRCLVLLFPNLQTIICDGRSDTDDAGWGTVKGLLDAYRVI
ncbi:hypothetical protein H0H81_011342 [Sphagnurus paluster]|uniref:Uncharacterized protein n=1 Tax=Sphagnurus paluster TaxID=117069 RepID=A0A9P7K6A6_9AGAR|nr:hypothetical protein H0H81_011342 [Sphagnurus paluster]